MNNAQKLSIALLIAGLAALVLAIPYLIPAKSIAECQKLSTSQNYNDQANFNDCIRAVAMIRGDRQACDFMASQSIFGQDYSCLQRVISPITRADEAKRRLSESDYNLRRANYTSPASCITEKYYKNSCWFQFALAERDPSYCDKIDTSSYAIKCKAVLIALDEAQGLAGAS